MGSLCPSSRFLAHHMANALTEFALRGSVVELGAGTGPVTAALIERGVEPSKLFVVELSEELATGLATRFPQANVLCRSADDIFSVVGGENSAVVSSLPFRSLPEEVCRSIMAEVDRVLSPGGLYIQFTYALFGELPYAPLGYKKVGTTLALLNIPPAKVVVYQKPE